MRVRGEEMNVGVFSFLVRTLLDVLSFFNFFFRGVGKDGFFFF